MPLDTHILGEGIYTPREAARLLGSTPQEVVRWTRGSGPNNPLWHAHYQFLDDTTEINFLDLIEVRVVKALRTKGISLQAIRFALSVAIERFNIDRPLSSIHFKTDGSEILMDAVEKDGQLVSLSHKHPGQKVFAEIIEQSVSGLEFEGERVARWRPEASQTIIIDPSRAFGDPILEKFGVSTRAIFDEYSKSEDYNYVSRLYEIEKKYIRYAVRFEKMLDLKNQIYADQDSI